MSGSGTPPYSEGTVEGTVDLDLTLSPGQSTVIVKDEQKIATGNHDDDSIPTNSETILYPNAGGHEPMPQAMEQTDEISTDANVNVASDSNDNVVTTTASESTDSKSVNTESEVEPQTTTTPPLVQNEGADSGQDPASSGDKELAAAVPEQDTGTNTPTTEASMSASVGNNSAAEDAPSDDVACISVDSQTINAPAADDEDFGEPRTTASAQKLSVGSSTDLIVDTSALMTSPPTPSVIVDDGDDTTPADEDFASTTRFGPENSIVHTNTGHVTRRTVHELPTSMEVRGDYRQGTESADIQRASSAEALSAKPADNNTTLSGAPATTSKETSAPESAEPVRWAAPRAGISPGPLSPMEADNGDYRLNAVNEAVGATPERTGHSDAVEVILKNLQTEKFDVKQLDMSPYQQEKTVTIANQKVKVGISIKEATNNALLPGAVVTHILPGSPASKCTDLTVGDLIIKVNGTSLIGLSFAKRLNVLRDTKKHAKTELTIVQTQKVYNHKLSVAAGNNRLSSLGDCDYALGMTLRDNLIISAVPGSVAGDAGIQPSHYLLQVDNTSVVTLSTEAIVDVLMKCKGDVHVVTMPAYIYDAQILGRGR